MHKGRSATLLPFLFFFHYFLWGTEESIIFKGLAADEALLKQKVLKLSPEQILASLKASGRFQRLELYSLPGFFCIEAEEYPKISSLHIAGNTKYSSAEVCRLLNLQEGERFNAVAYREGVRTFLARANQDGYSHLYIEKMNLADNGAMILQVNEGLLADVRAEGGVVAHGLLRAFFRECLGQPFQVGRIKYLMEELLNTEVFYSVKAEVLQENGRPVLLLKLDRKRLHSLSLRAAYAGGHDLRLALSSLLLSRSDRLHFVNPDFFYWRSKEITVARLGCNGFDFRAKLHRFHAGLASAADYFHNADATELVVWSKPYLFFPLGKHLSFSPFLRCGLDLALNGTGDRALAELGGTLGLEARSAFGETSFSLAGEAAFSLLSNYRDFRCRFDFSRKIRTLDLQLSAYARKFAGTARFLPRADMPAAWLFGDAHLLDRACLWLNGELFSPLIGRLLRFGFFGQYLLVNRSHRLGGLLLRFYPLGLPLDLRLFREETKWRFQAGLLWQL